MGPSSTRGGTEPGRAVQGLFPSDSLQTEQNLTASSAEATA